MRWWTELLPVFVYRWLLVAIDAPRVRLGGQSFRTGSRMNILFREDTKTPSTSESEASQ